MNEPAPARAPAPAPDAASQAIHELLRQWADEQNRLWRGETLPPEAVTYAVAEDFAAVQWAPWYEGQCWRGDAAAWLEGTRQAAAAARGAPLQWSVEVLRVIPRADDEVVACYEVRVARDGRDVATSVFLETWRHGRDGWRLLRHTAEKAALKGTPKAG